MFDLTKEEKRKKWDEAIAIAKLDGGNHSSKFLELVEKEINGEITIEEMRNILILECMEG